MSIFLTLDRLEAEGRLVRYLPPEGLPVRRNLYLTTDFSRELVDPRTHFQFFGQIPAINRLFDRWVTGRSVIARLKGDSPDADLARLQPPPEDIWEFRLTQHAPQLRIFMRFAAPNTIVATNAANRDTLGSARTRTGKPGRTWREAMYECEAEWNRLFGAAAFRANRIAGYVEKNCTGSE